MDTLEIHSQDVILNHVRLFFNFSKFSSLTLHKSQLLWSHLNKTFIVTLATRLLVDHTLSVATITDHPSAHAYRLTLVRHQIVVLNVPSILNVQVTKHVSTRNVVIHVQALVVSTQFVVSLITHRFVHVQNMTLVILSPTVILNHHHVRTRFVSLFHFPNISFTTQRENLLSMMTLAFPLHAEPMLNAQTVFVHVSQNTKVIPILDVDRSALSITTVLVTKHAYETNVSIHVLELVGKGLFVKWSITFRCVTVHKEQLEMHLLNASLTNVCTLD